MVAIYRVSVVRAFKILESIPEGLSKRDVIGFISHNFGISKRTSELYIRALYSWGFLSGEDSVKKRAVSFLEFINSLRTIVLREIPDKFYDALSSINSRNYTITPYTILIELERNGVKLSYWKIKSLFRFLRQLFFLADIKKYAINLSREKISYEEIIYLQVAKKGTLTLDKLLELVSDLPIGECDLKKSILRLLHKNKISIDVPETILGVWEKSLEQDICSAAEVSGRLAQKILELSKIDRRVREITNCDGDKCTVSIVRGEFVVYSL